MKKTTKKTQVKKVSREELIDQIEKLFEGGQKALNVTQKRNILKKLQEFRNEDLEFNIELAQRIIVALEKYQGAKKAASKAQPLNPKGKVQIKCLGYWSKAGKHECQEILEGSRQEIGMKANRCESCRKHYKPLKGMSKTKPSPKS
jgi:hypothetical protein